MCCLCVPLFKLVLLQAQICLNFNVRCQLTDPDLLLDAVAACSARLDEGRC
jgi:hypothetical protein